MAADRTKQGGGYEDEDKQEGHQDSILRGRAVFIATAMIVFV